MLMLSICSRMFCLSVVNFGQWRKKWFNVSVSKSQIQIGLSVFKKLCLNVSSLKWLRSKWRRVRKMSPFGWMTLKTLLLRSFIKFKIFFLKVKYEGELPISKSNLFHSINADGKKKKSRKLFITSNWEITKVWLFFVWHELLFEGIMSKKYFRDCSLKIM